MKPLEINVQSLYPDKKEVLLDGVLVSTGMLQPTQKIYDQIMGRPDIQDLIEIGFISVLESTEEKDSENPPNPVLPPNPLSLKNPVK